MWPMLIMAGVQAMTSAREAAAKRAQQQAMNKAASEQTRYSWASKMQPGQLDTSYTPDATSAALAGGMLGAAQGQSLSSAMDKANQQNDPMAYFQQKTAGGAMDQGANQAGQLFA